MHQKPITNKWKWAAKVKSQAIAIDADGTATAPTIEMANNMIRRDLAEQFKTSEECVIVHKIHQVGNRA